MSNRRRAATLIELLVTVGIVAILFALTLSAVQKVRDAANRTTCLNRMRQIALGLHSYHDGMSRLPPGQARPAVGDDFFHMSWLARLLPYVEQDNLWARVQSDYQANPRPFAPPRHYAIGQVVRVFTCPNDIIAASAFPYNGNQNLTIAFASYMGSSGRNAATRDGVFFRDSNIRFEQIPDGLSNTLMVGERPPSPENRFGWWYSAAGDDGQGSLDYVLGTQERNLVPESWYRSCGSGPFPYQQFDRTQFCSVFQFSSYHSSGASFAFCDGSARVVAYSAGPVLVPLSTRAGGEIVPQD